MQPANFCNPTVFAQVERVSMRASAGRSRPGMPLSYAPRAIPKRVETADESSRIVVWWGHPTLVLILRCGAAASKGGLQPAARSLELPFEAPDAGTAG